MIVIVNGMNVVLPEGDTVKTIPGVGKVLHLVFNENAYEDNYIEPAKGIFEAYDNVAALKIRDKSDV